MFGSQRRISKFTLLRDLAFLVAYCSVVTDFDSIYNNPTLPLSICLDDLDEISQNIYIYIYIN